MFRVGGGSEGGNATSAPTPRFEYIVADQPNAAATVVHGHLFRQPLSQIAAIEQYANEGDTIVSEEVLKVRLLSRRFRDKKCLMQTGSRSRV